MANKKLFQTTMAVNEAGGRAYALTAKHALAQYAATGCLNGTFYASAEEQLRKVLELCAQVDDLFIARTAVYCRERGYMKDMPALLCAVLAVRNTPLLETIFRRVLDNGKMLRNFVQIVRSGVTGRKSLGTAPKRMILRWLESRRTDALFRDSVGQKPSLVDVIRMVHPKPQSKEREALYGYLIGRPHDPEALPPLVREFEAFRKGASAKVPDVPFQMLTSLDLSAEVWVEIARNAPWQMTRMNLNTFDRHCVFADEEVTNMIAARLADPETIRKARAFPYQLLMAYRAASEDVPLVVREALQDAMEIAIENVPAIDGQVYVCPDVSGSMGSVVTGRRGSASSAVRCIDVAALVTAAIVRKNPGARVLPFEERVVDLRLNPRDSVMTNAEKLAEIGGGGTACSAPLALLNQQMAHGDLVIFVSDNESWADSRSGRGTEMMKQWERFRQRNRKARLVCIDVQPYGTAQTREEKDVLNVGGFSDAVFTLVADFAAGRLDAGHWTKVIEDIAIAEPAVA
ncbi:MAG TPA: TROVE domain-containing protein [Thermoanaerobaculia bacterium]|nr:TROVE domain-containing protein [Thermoanaerobaculia bacterium]